MEADQKETKIVELKMDMELLESVQDIALNRFNARINHKSNKPEVTATLNYLIRKGIENLDSSYQDNDKINPIVYPDNVVTNEALDNAITQLETKFQNELGEFKSFVADTAPTLETMDAAIAPLKEEIESLKKLSLAA
jgi:archaellum component FlaC